ncbi:hypothetical protein K450DRAFT_245847 [Umbelopsis ramanniana AG]|uniref:BLOC-1-related complex subunit 7 n=1 Tax=Umbelopsis ramanniana AG TaxID=1314678 RepID=A0AAD5HBY6_UMBRA|nr:uncharacterized protein K450DRAFT_245847 [Umbelopsis ramanniana AG]KAI8578640.1 hypothetical protein K450DRAFT_245847 [Umbelopsis ramanniana AG]
MSPMPGLGGRLDQDFTALMTAIPDHTAKSFQALRSTAQSVSKYAEETQTCTKDTLNNLEIISTSLAKLRDQKLPMVSMPQRTQS